MAGDWIKMREDLRTHPRFLSLYSALISCEMCGLAMFVCTDEPFDELPRRDDGVTDTALRYVTEEALRRVTRVTLCDVWCAVNAHCKVSGNDAVMTPMALTDIDAIAGFDGFGAAMLASGWVREYEGNSLVFPNFLDYNEPACVRRGPAKTGAERQAEYRERQRSGVTKSVTKSVTRSDESDGREEKRREEKREDKLPSGVSPETPRAASSGATQPLLTFPCDGREKEWHLTGPVRDDLAAAYPSLDILGECRKALAWINANPGGRKTHGGMRRFLTNWMSKSQNSGMGRGAPKFAAAPSRDERLDMLEFPDDPAPAGGPRP